MAVFLYELKLRLWSVVSVTVVLSVLFSLIGIGVGFHCQGVSGSNPV